MNIYFKLLLVFFLSSILSYFFIKIFLLKITKKNYILNQREELLNKENKSQIKVGGICFIVASILSLLFVDYNILLDKNVQIILLPSIIFYILGLIDDYLKRKTYKGLSATIRAVSEIIIAFIFIYYLPLDEYIFHLPFNNYVYLGSIIVIIIPIIIFGTTNSLNLTDGMDGLLSFLFIFSSLPIMLKSLLINEHNISLLLISIYGSLISFLRFNIHPAKLFMGDQGSLFLGGLFAFSCFVLKIEYILPISGLIYVIETISVIIQVISFNVFNKRVFLMSPLHHHYEIKGVKEWKIVYMFILVQIILMIVSICLIL